MLSRFYAHIVWTTRDRAPLINRDVEDFLRRFLPAVAHQQRCTILEMGMVRDHIHVLIEMHPTTAIPTLMQRLKGGSAVVAWKEQVTAWGELKWAKGYSITSVSPNDIDAVRQYVRDQPLRHPGLAIGGMKPPLGDSAVA